MGVPRVNSWAGVRGHWGALSWLQGLRAPRAGTPSRRGDGDEARSDLEVAAETPHPGARRHLSATGGASGGTGTGRQGCGGAGDG